MIVMFSMFDADILILLHALNLFFKNDMNSLVYMQKRKIW